MNIDNQPDIFVDCPGKCGTKHNQAYWYQEPYCANCGTRKNNPAMPPDTRDPGQDGPSQAERDTETALTRIERGDGEITFRQSKALAASYRAKDAALQAANKALAEERRKRGEAEVEVLRLMTLIREVKI